MKNYLEKYGIEVVDAEVIQYGSKEFAIKKPEGEGEVMPVLVDFAHGKPMFVIHTDHHDTQAGVEKDTATNFKSSRSNVETISQVVSPKEIFPSDDILLISTVDSANFAVNQITPEMVMNYLYKYDKDSSLKRNKMLMGLVVNKLLLAYKNKPRFLENLVLNSQPSLLSILNNIKKEAIEKGYVDPEQLTKNKENYIQSRKEKGVETLGNIISQYGFGSTTKSGAYDRYTPFKNNPDSDFLVTGMPMGMVQASCNPFKEDRALKGVNLGEIKDEVLDVFRKEFEGLKITFGVIKRVAEQEADFSSVGFTFKDMEAIYGESPSYKIDGGENLKEILNNISSKLYRGLSQKQKELLDKVSVNGFDVIRANSGGHKCITNISGLNFLYRDNKGGKTDNIPSELLPIANYSGKNSFLNDIKSKLLTYGRLSDKQIEMAMNQIKKEGGSPLPSTETVVSQSNKTYVDVVKQIQQEFVNILNNKIGSPTNLKESKESNKKYYVDESKLGGKGVFAKKDLKKGETIGLLHIIKKMRVDYDFTELGRTHNHKDEPNCHNERIDNKRYLVASKNIKKGEELTTDYRLQPDLEQPQDWFKGLKEQHEKMWPQKDGYRTYSPFKDLEYIIVDGNGIDCDNIVYDLILIGDNGTLKFCKKNTGSYYLPGASKVVEIPLKDGEDGDKFLEDKRMFVNWLHSKLRKIDKDGEIKEKILHF